MEGIAADTTVLDVHCAQHCETFSKEALRFPRVALAPAWRMLLFGDGSPTRLISLLSGVALTVSVLGMEALPQGAAADAALEAQWQPLALPAHTVAPPRVLRRVWLEAPSGQRVGYACSWWNQEDAEAFLPSRAQPIGDALAGSRREIHRELLCVAHAVGHAGLEAGLGLPSAQGALAGALAPGGDWGASELWGRWYVMRQGGRPLCVIYEVFSPSLEQHLGQRY